MLTMEHRYLNVCRQLVELGYKYTLKPDSLLLVERLLADLIETTESLRKYMKIAQEAVEERDNLKFGAEPYRCDNAKLVKECNELHLAFLQVKEQNDKQQKELKKQITVLEKDKRDLVDNQKKLRDRLREFELETVRKTDRYLQNELRQSGKSKSTAVLLKSERKDGKPDHFKINSAMALADQKVANLMKDMNKMKQNQLELTELNCDLKNKLNNREKEIKRLMAMLEGGRPANAVNEDCCYQDVNVKLLNKQDEINYLQKNKIDIESKLKEARCKQHEAMKHALQLAERNTILEKELRDIDEMALAVEQECNTTVKNNGQKVRRLQERMQNTMLELQRLEKEVSSLKREREMLVADNEAIKIEKRHLQSVLESALEDKKYLSDKMNKFVIIEKDLNNEIDRLVRHSSEQKRIIAELKGRVITEQSNFSATDELYLEEARVTRKSTNKVPKSSASRRSPPPRSTSPFKKSLPPSKKSPPPIKKAYHQKRENDIFSNKTNDVRIGLSSERKTIEAYGRNADLYDDNFVPNNTPLPSTRNKEALYDDNVFPNNAPLTSTRNKAALYDDNFVPDNTPLPSTRNKEANICDPEICMQKLKEMVDEEMNRRYPNKTNSLERLKNERDFYIKEYQQLIEQFRNIYCKPDDTCQLLKKLNEKEDLIISLQHENQTLGKEKHNLMSRLENVRDFNDNGDTLTMKSSLKRLERERDIFKTDVERLEEERDSMKQRLKVASELHNAEIERYQQMLADHESKVRKFETERHDLLQNQGSRRAAITTLEDQCDTLKEQLRNTQAELAQQRTIYSQLKTLHEQTDRALADSQGQLMQLEKELSNSLKRDNVNDTNTMSLNRDITSLRHDLSVLKQTLTEMDQEKDTLLLKLDEKTERIASLEVDLKKKDSKLEQLEYNVGDLRKTVSSTVEEKNTKEYLLQNTAAEITSIRTDLQNALKAKEAALMENRRLQDDLAACTVDSRRANGDLEIAKRQIDDLKRQLQHYVAEVKRIEDLMSSKEIERSEMLDQFRNLSHEAIVLETNNHSLENEASESKVQLSVALDHANDLETQLDEQNAMIRTYEKQVSEMTSMIATLEIQAKHYRMEKEHVETDLSTVQDLCNKLDRQKDELQRQLKDQQEMNVVMERDCKKTKRDSEALKQNLEKDHNTVESLENLLAENRQQVVEQRILNDDLQSEIMRLTNQIRELETNLATATEHLDVYQEKALEYSHQNKQLRREIANERFYQSKEEFHKKSALPNTTKGRNGYSMNIDLTENNVQHNSRNKLYPESINRGQAREGGHISKNSLQNRCTPYNPNVPALTNMYNDQPNLINNEKKSVTRPTASFPEYSTSLPKQHFRGESIDEKSLLNSYFANTIDQLSNVSPNHGTHRNNQPRPNIATVNHPKNTNYPPKHSEAARNESVQGIDKENLVKKRTHHHTHKSHSKSPSCSETSCDSCNLNKFMKKERCPHCLASSYNFNLSFIKQLQSRCNCRDNCAGNEEDNSNEMQFPL